MMEMCKWLLSYIENNELNPKQTTNPIDVVLIYYKEFFFCSFINKQCIFTFFMALFRGFSLHVLLLFNGLKANGEIFVKKITQTCLEI